MAESAGIFFEISISEKDIKRFLNHKFSHSPFGGKIGYYFSKLFNECVTNPRNVFIFHYNKENSKCFVAWLQNNFEEKLLQPFDELLTILSSYKIGEAPDYAIVASIYPNVFSGYKIQHNSFGKVSVEQIPASITKKLMDRFWSFSKNNDFPEPQKALRKRDYIYKNFKNYYKRYLTHLEEVEKPNKIMLATKDKPFYLFNTFYAYDGKVYYLFSYTKQMIEVSNADPLTLKLVVGILVDKNFVFTQKNLGNFPPNNQKNIPFSGLYDVHKYVITDGIDGGSFTYVKNKSETVYWKDKNAVYIHTRDKKNTCLKKVENADVDTFEYLNFCFGRDKNNVFFEDKIVDIDPENYTLNKNGFMFDNKNIFYYDNKIPLNASTFKVISYECSTNPFIGPFVLEDKNGTYKFNRNRKWKDDKIKPILNKL
ncbi:MAG: DKNYY domain-containing protein [Flavobacteriaceae bacterium]|nr:DKNYY domain-containing protein [Flavobacteriaceae bacterium]